MALPQLKVRGVLLGLGPSPKYLPLAPYLEGKRRSYSHVDKKFFRRVGSGVSPWVWTHPEMIGRYMLSRGYP